MSIYDREFGRPFCGEEGGDYGQNVAVEAEVVRSQTLVMLLPPC